MKDFYPKWDKAINLSIVITLVPPYEFAVLRFVLNDPVGKANDRKLLRASNNVNLWREL